MISSTRPAAVIPPIAAPVWTSFWPPLAFTTPCDAAWAAALLFTVQSHLDSARAKLGAANRSELGSRLQDLGYLPD